MRVVGIGDNVVDRYLTLGRMFPGGNALNVAVFARRQGAEAAYIGALGQDVAGRLVRAALEAEGVDVSRVRVVAGPNAYADVALVEGDRRFVGSSVGVSLFQPDARDDDLLCAADLVHSSTYSGLDEWVSATRTRLPLSFDFSDRAGRAYVAALAPGLVCAQFSGAGLSAGQAEDLARWAVSLGARTTLVTRGAEGVVACVDGRCWTQPAVRVAVVDTLGAGDAFLAAFLVAYLGGARPPDALAASAQAAAATCAYYGAFGRGSAIEAIEAIEAAADAAGAAHDSQR